MTNWTDTAERLRLVRVAGERFLALWAAESLLQAPSAWERLSESLQDSSPPSDIHTWWPSFRADA